MSRFGMACEGKSMSLGRGDEQKPAVYGVVDHRWSPFVGDELVFISALFVWCNCSAAATKLVN